jgi:septum formation protein
LILASGSPRRLQILREHGLEPLVIEPDIDEALRDFDGFEGLQLALQELALEKARAVQSRLLQPQPQPQLILAADTVVYLERVLGKPKDRDEARSMLSKLRGREHQVLTAVALIDIPAATELSYCETATVVFSSYNDEAIEAYINTKEPYDKAGSYAIQGIWGQQVTAVQGELETVIGLPWKRLAEELAARYSCLGL